MNATWYDLLDVAPDASEDEVKTAWKASIAELDPTDRKFRVYNQAAEVLLDPRKRAAYDAELAAAAPPDEVDEEPVALGADPAPTAGAPTPIVRPGGVPAWLLVVVAALTAAVMGTCAWVWYAYPSDTVVEESSRAAQSAAERAIVPILSYDYTSLEQDESAAESYMTSDYRKAYASVFEVIKQNAPATKTVVRAEVVSSGIVRAGEDRVEVLLFVNRPTTNKQQTEPVVYKDQVRVQLVKVDGNWLVDCLITAQGSNCG